MSSSVAAAQAVQAAAYYPDATGDAQQPADVAVMMVTVLRPSILEALGSIYAQRFEGRIQLLVGVDVARGDSGLLEQALSERPPHISVLALTLPYSTAMWNGGLHGPNDGGALRATMALLANARHLAQLDDDNVWLPDHLRLLKEAIAGKAYAYTHRVLVDDATNVDLGPDLWDSVGPSRGRLKAIGGFVDPNCLMIDKVTLVRTLACYADAMQPGPTWAADRLLFSQIAGMAHGRIPTATVRYRIRRDHVLWPELRRMKAEGKLDGFNWTTAEIGLPPPV